MTLTLETETRDVPRKNLTLDKRCQLRAEIRRTTVDDYRDLLEEEMEAAKKEEREPVWPFPPLDIFWRAGSAHLVADGWHRKMGADEAKWSEPIPCIVHDGGIREAILFAAGANASHGVRRSNEDKRRAVLTLLKDREWRKWASNEIARRCNVSAGLVEIVRQHEGGAANPEQRLHYSKGKLRYTSRERDRRKPKTLAEQVKEALGDVPTHCPYCGRLMERE